MSSLACVARRAGAAALRQHARRETTLTSLTQEEIVLEPPFAHWSKVIREAERIVGYPTSFMNLRWLLSDEFANMALHLRKLVGSDHPLLTTAKNLLYSEQNNLQPWGLVILLVSKSVKDNMTVDNAVYEQQRVLAELTEMIRTGHLIHKGLINIPFSNRVKNAETAVFGNKIGILTGDYLLVTANGMLAKLRNQNLSYLISSALRDLSEGEFFGERDGQNMPLPGNPETRVNRDDVFEITSRTSPLEVEGALGNARREWTLRSIYSGASLLGRGCQGTLLLDGQSEQCQDSAYLFGCHLGLAWKAANELHIITSNSTEMSLVSAPVLFALQDNPKLYEFIEQAKESVTAINYEELRRKVLKTDAVEITRLLYEGHAKKAAELVTEMGDNESVNAIKKIIATL